jgi:hypothetical protein
MNSCKLDLRFIFGALVAGSFGLLVPSSASAGPFSIFKEMDRGQHYVDDYGNQCINPKKIRPSVVKLANSVAGLLEQSVAFTNSCNVRVPIRVCYARSKRCKEDYLMPNETRKFVLGFDAQGSNATPQAGVFAWEYYELIEPGTSPKIGGR